LIKDAGIDFVVISWWGDNQSDPYQQFIENSTRQVFQTAEDNRISLKFAILVEAFNKTNNPSYNYSEIYNHIYDEYVLNYASIYYYYNDKPLICFFNDPDNVPGLTLNGTVQQDRTERFSVLLVGEQNYTQWTYNDLDVFDNASYVPHLDEVSVTPRYDDSRLNRNESCIVDYNLVFGVYSKEWQKAIQLWKDGKIDTIMITSWNEYKERTEIEPHYDGTAANKDPYLLYNETKDFINQIQQLAK
jgi:hypothetical protein